jgi:hypothetical protein
MHIQMFGIQGCTMFIAAVQLCIYEEEVLTILLVSLSSSSSRWWTGASCTQPVKFMILFISSPPSPFPSPSLIARIVLVLFQICPILSGFFSYFSVPSLFLSMISISFFCLPFILSYICIFAHLWCLFPLFPLYSIPSA